MDVSHEPIEDVDIAMDADVTHVPSYKFEIRVVKSVKFDLKKVARICVYGSVHFII